MLTIVIRIETDETNNDRQIVAYESSEIYLDEEIVLLNKENNDSFLKPDNYSYNFFIQIPKNAPTSFEHEIGQIRYNLISKIDIPWYLLNLGYKIN